ncbi:unnamed protein product, partial [Allacma fusca]
IYCKYYIDREAQIKVEFLVHPHPAVQVGADVSALTEETIESSAGNKTNDNVADKEPLEKRPKISEEQRDERKQNRRNRRREKKGT